MDDITFFIKRIFLVPPPPPPTTTITAGGSTRDLASVRKMKVVGIPNTEYRVDLRYSSTTTTTTTTRRTKKHDGTTSQSTNTTGVPEATMCLSLFHPIRSVTWEERDATVRNGNVRCRENHTPTDAKMLSSKEASVYHRSNLNGWSRPCVTRIPPAVAY